jgi:UDP-glucose 4-epimerase
MRALITGGAGFIGSHLAEELAMQGNDVVILDNMSSGKKENLKGIKVKLYKGDVRNMSHVLKASKGCDCIFHMAAIVSVQASIVDPFETEQVNALGTLNVLEAARENKVRKVVFSSSAAIYGDEVKLPAVESSPPQPISPYGITKMLGEYYCKVYANIHGIDTCVLRYFNVYGPRQDARSPYSGVLAIFMKLIKDGKSPIVFGDGTQTRDFVYVKDVVRANMLASKAKTHGDAFNVATGKESSLNDLVRILSKIHKKSIRPTHEPPRPGDIVRSVADVRKAKKIGFKAEYSLEQGLIKTIG